MAPPLLHQHLRAASFSGPQLQKLPWQGPPRYDNVTRVAQWTAHCGPVVCESLSSGAQQRREHKGHHKNASQVAQELVARGIAYTPPPSVAVHEQWVRHCNGSSLGSSSVVGGGVAALVGGGAPPA